MLVLLGAKLEVLIDNYVFNNELEKENLISLFKSIIPDNLISDFHISIVIENSVDKSKQNKLEGICNDIGTELTAEYKIIVEIMSHYKNNEFHKRILISNYHSITSHYRFDIFKKGKAHKSVDPGISGNYKTIKKDEGDPEIKDIERQLKLVANGSNFNTIFRNDKASLSFTNRLLR